MNTSSTVSLPLAESLVPDLVKLTPDQFAWVARLVLAMAVPVHSRRNPDSDVFPDDRSLGLFFLYLVTHHALSAEPFKKEKFEYALEKVMSAIGRPAGRAPSRTNPGHDLTVGGERWSLKSEAHRAIKTDEIYISKWMELGKGEWLATEESLRTLCDRFLHHLSGYDRIFVLRCLTPDDAVSHHYELVELPKALLTAAAAGTFTVMDGSGQLPKPGYCRVSDDVGPAFELYFDGGTERKLRLQKFRRSAGIFHADWRFETPAPTPSPGE